MKISFTIPAHNEEAHIGMCIQSIKNELARHPVDAEIIVANNASTDRTGAVASSFPGVRVIDEPQKGVRYARQAGYLAAKGELVACIDADNMLTAHWLDVVLEEFSRNPHVIALSGPYRFYDLPLSGRVLTRSLEYLLYVFYFYTHFIRGRDGMECGGNFIIKRWALEKIGGFDTSVEFAADDVYTLRELERVGVVKWSWRLPVYASGRRFAKIGIIRTCIRWVRNYFSVLRSGKAVAKEYSDIRTPAYQLQPIPLEDGGDGATKSESTQ
ncbi:MAG: Glycosyltransferase [Candidatus Kaiserbacteria bacterium GW2011_GWB1_52_6]|uniref:Glycosyltransferase n=3 Tax=Candidatus Kaiseribacteriota TaxID=1752734 RepID=A0A0G1XM84_9BACT|nr:MAG: Glycosyltransferase [Candidatus Kaiserbacteria bacterium GW2011_GWA2_52_12]KKW27963.1 MAG: Glycosyltransferase [Candidatus Kaiserbacteria bacterium GW2011_GWB1_52_6]KKW31980.1 MAG: Glycosyltransferase [Candidatus Kaiserbacteria bacterium GW2011_GWC2_52_8b]